MDWIPSYTAILHLEKISDTTNRCSALEGPTKNLARKETRLIHWHNCTLTSPEVETNFACVAHNEVD